MPYLQESNLDDEPNCKLTDQPSLHSLCVTRVHQLGGVNGKIAIRLHLVHFSLTIGRTNITIKTTPNLVGQQ